MNIDETKYTKQVSQNGVITFTPVRKKLTAEDIKPWVSLYWPAHKISSGVCGTPIEQNCAEYCMLLEGDEPAVLHSSGSQTAKYWAAWANELELEVR